MLSNTDACATRLHDLCGPLLFYYQRNHRLPGNINELADMPGYEPSMAFACPVSKRPYVYNPVGIVTTDKRPRPILYDPAPSHSGMRWAIIGV